ncbi:tyrosine protein kinase [Bacillus pseudomycoides]|uniref:CpsD/CapB family tyrosine-protein kinase n=1 Tax=Bacillus pseudomycoides TaxID=64104 RepID=UPI000BF52211|nr:CpsD/CapB family tyrosine-protein kinase [Bacillus pseudomycoides]PEP39827.1 tyrosine protein kinase [Bacillus pseudomycoides]PEP47861.1 tyrosine protein kinase [Bacillus pseudomycoides]
MILNKKQSRPLDNSNLIAHTAPNSKVAEEYRTIRTNLQFVSEADKKRTIIITSPGYGEGKTITVANLAVSMAQQDERVLVIDADLRTSELHKIFGIENRSGLTNILEGKATLEKAVIQTEIKNVHILTSGSEVNNPAELLSLPSMQDLINKVIEQYDVILFDSSPLLEVTDTSILASQCDGVLLVLSCNQTASEAVVEAERVLGLSNSRFLGAILNKKV